MHFFNNISLKQRLSFAVGCGLLMITVVLLVIGQQLYNQRDRDFRAAYLGGVSSLWKAVSENERNEMAANFKALTRDRKLGAALYKEQKEAIREAIGPTATRLQAMEIADNVIVMNKRGEIGFSLIEAESTPPVLAMKTISSGKSLEGFELTVDGRLVNLVSFPIYDRADLVGVGVFEKGLARVAEKIKAANDHEVYLLDNNGAFQVSTSEVMPRVNGRELQNSVYWESDDGPGVVGIGAVPLADDEGRIIAVLITQGDVTESAEEKRQLRLVSYIIGLSLLLLLTAGVGLYMRHALRPLDTGIHFMEKIAEGDLSSDITCDRSDEFKRLLDAMQKMNIDLRGLVGKVMGASDELISTVGTVKATSLETNQGVDRQRQEVNQLATALTQMTATANEVAENIHQLMVTAGESLKATDTGNLVVQQSVQDISLLSDEISKGGLAVSALQEKSQRIGVVIDVIKNIAEQTNLLALNAAIEAARAGEQGRGFAVVADEVRTLAGRTQESTHEIEQIIGALQQGVGDAVAVMVGSVEHARQASSQANAIGETLDSVREQVSKITEFCGQVATAAEEQRVTTEEMNRNVHRISEVAESTARQADVAAERVNYLTGLSTTLKQVMSGFKVS